MGTSHLFRPWVLLKACVKAPQCRSQPDPQGCLSSAPEKMTLAPQPGLPGADSALAPNYMTSPCLQPSSLTWPPVPGSLIAALLAHSPVQLKGVAALSGDGPCGESRLPFYLLRQRQKHCQFEAYVSYRVQDCPRQFRRL